MWSCRVGLPIKRGQAGRGDLPQREARVGRPTAPRVARGASDGGAPATSAQGVDQVPTGKAAAGRTTSPR